jgi:hypothetical protein
MGPGFKLFQPKRLFPWGQCYIIFSDLRHFLTKNCHFSQKPILRSIFLQKYQRFKQKTPFLAEN